VATAVAAVGGGCCTLDERRDVDDVRGELVTSRFFSCSVFTLVNEKVRPNVWSSRVLRRCFAFCMSEGEAVAAATVVVLVVVVVAPPLSVLLRRPLLVVCRWLLAGV